MLSAKAIETAQHFRFVATDKHRSLSTSARQQNDNFSINASAIYNLREELERLRADFLHEEVARDIHLSLSFDEDIRVAFWDMPILQEYVLTKLLSDAIFNTPVGGAIAIIVKKQNNYRITIQISDTRPEIDASEMKSRFGHYSESETSAQDQHQWVSDARKCIHLHKGELSIVDDPMFSGVTFLISMPLYELCMQ